MAEIRELFIDELAEVTGGGPIEDILNAIGAEPGDPEFGGGGLCCTTMACGEEGPIGCYFGNCC